MTLGRKGRPPKVRSLGDGRYGVPVYGFDIRFKLTKKGSLKLLARGNPEPADIAYARSLVGLYVRGSLRSD